RAMTNPRTGIPGVKGLGSVVNESAWGTATADRRYGRLPQVDMRPKDMSMPQFKQDGRGPDWADDHPNDWVRGFGKGGIESAEGKPGFKNSQGYNGGKK